LYVKAARWRSPSKLAPPASAAPNDAAVGQRPVETRASFAALLDKIEGKGVRTVLVEDASRFARDLITQELGLLALIKREVRVLTAAGEDLTASDDPTRKLMRQIGRRLRRVSAGAGIALARSGSRAASHVLYPAAVAEAKRLRRASPKTGERRSLRDISAQFARAGTSRRRARRSRRWPSSAWWKARHQPFRGGAANRHASPPRAPAPAPLPVRSLPQG
jgi:DNA invertase Pin-like site-specific DNA recombinase